MAHVSLYNLAGSAIIAKGKAAISKGVYIAHPEQYFPLPPFKYEPSET